MIKKVCCVALGLWIGLTSYVMFNLNRRVSVAEENVIELEENILSLTKSDVEISKILELHQEYNDVSTDVLEMIYEYLF